MNRNNGLIAVFLLSLSTLAFASDNQSPALLLAQGLYGMNKPNVHADFIRAIGATDGKAPEIIINRLRQDFNSAFAKEKIEEITPDVKYRTYVVSLELLRADKYQVDRPDGTADIYLPVSLRLYITNILSGEVLYSNAITKYSQLRESKSDIESGASTEALKKEYLDKAVSIVDTLVKTARENFKPFQISATVVAKPFGLYVVDKGTAAGITTGTELVNTSGAGIRILHAGKTYAVGESTLGDVQLKDILSMYSTVAASDIIKPKALIINADSPADLPGNQAALEFTENLGNQAAFTVTPINPDFQAVLQETSRTKGIRQDEVTQKRIPPDYFIRIKVADPIVYLLPTSKQFSKIRVLSGTAWAELLDAQGRVIHVAQSTENLQDETLDGGIAFADTDRRKILYGNLLKSLSEKFIKEVKFRSDMLSVAEASEQVILADPQGSIITGQNIRLYRLLNDKKLFSEPVYIPIWDMNVANRDSNSVILEKQLSISPIEQKIRKEDIALLSSSGGGGGGSQSAEICSSLQDKGTIHPKGLEAISYFAIGSSSRIPYYGGETSFSQSFPTLSQVRDGSMKHAGFKSINGEVNKANALCYEPLIKIDEVSRDCNDAKGLCDIDIKIIAGVKLMQNGQSLGNKFLSMKSLLKNAPLNDSTTFIQAQATQKLFSLLVDSVRQLPIPAMNNQQFLPPPLTQGEQK